MGLFPCSLCAKRFRGAAQAAYPSVLWNGIRASAHLRLCGECYQQMAAFLSGYVVDYSSESSPNEGDCPECGQNGVTDSGPVLFVTLYPRGSERIDAMASLHEKCAHVLEGRWKLSSAS